MITLDLQNKITERKLEKESKTDHASSQNFKYISNFYM